MSPRLILSSAVLALSCSSVLADDLETMLSGKVITNGRVDVSINTDGTLAGGPIAGTWEIVDGEWCRTLTAPEQVAGSECQTVMIDGQNLTFTSPDGRTTEWNFVD